MILDAELSTDDLRDPPRRPDLTSKAKRLSTARQQLRQVRELLPRESRRWPRRWPMPQPCDAGLPATVHPLTNGTLRDPKRGSDLALRPALLFQFPGAQPSPLAPVLAYRSSLSHAYVRCTFRTLRRSPGTH